MEWKCFSLCQSLLTLPGWLGKNGFNGDTDCPEIIELCFTWYWRRLELESNSWISSELKKNLCLCLYHHDYHVKFIPKLNKYSPLISSTEVYIMLQICNIVDWVVVSWYAVMFPDDHRSLKISPTNSLLPQWPGEQLWLKRMPSTIFFLVAYFFCFSFKA